MPEDLAAGDRVENGVSYQHDFVSSPVSMNW